MSLTCPHPSFERTNQALRGIFAEAAARKAAEAGRLGRLLEVLRGDTGRTTLTLNLGGCREIDLSAVAALAGHPNLERIIIDCAYCSIPSMSWIGEGLTKLPRLLELRLNLSGCSDLHDYALASLVDLCSLQTLRIDLSYSSISDVSGIGIALAGLRNLKDLGLDFGCCAHLEDVAPLSNGLASLNSLEDLKLNFQYCTCTVILSGLEEIGSLRRLSIDYSYTNMGTKGYQRTGLDFIKKQKNVEKLKLSFEGCRQLVHLAHFGAIGTFQHIEELDLNFAYTSVKGANKIRNLNVAPKLRCVRLNCAKCSQLQNVGWLPEAVSRIEELEVDFSECRGLPDCLQRHFETRQDISAAFAKAHNVSTLESTMRVGEQVKVFVPEEKRWVAAKVRDVHDDESTTVEVTRSNGLGQHIQVTKAKKKERIRKSMNADTRWP
jgi:adenylate cyclase class IV